MSSHSPSLPPSTCVLVTQLDRPTISLPESARSPRGVFVQCAHVHAATEFLEEPFNPVFARGCNPDQAVVLLDRLNVTAAGLQVTASGSSVPWFERASAVRASWTRCLQPLYERVPANDYVISFDSLAAQISRCVLLRLGTRTLCLSAEHACTFILLGLVLHRRAYGLLRAVIAKNLGAAPEAVTALESRCVLSVDAVETAHGVTADFSATKCSSCSRQFRKLLQRVSSLACRVARVSGGRLRCDDNTRICACLLRSASVPTMRVDGLPAVRPVSGVLQSDGHCAALLHGMRVGLPGAVGRTPAAVSCGRGKVVCTDPFGHWGARTLPSPPADSFPLRNETCIDSHTAALPHARRRKSGSRTTKRMLRFRRTLCAVHWRISASNSSPLTATSPTKVVCSRCAGSR